MRALHAQLSHIVGDENLRTDAAALVACAAVPDFGEPLPDAPLPVAVVTPRNPAQLRELLILCSKENIAARIRGAGTAPGQPSFPKDRQSLLILTTALNRILEVDPANRVATAQAGVTCAELAAATAAAGLFYPGDPDLANLATLGGILADNAAGPGVLKYGFPATYLHQLRAFTASGMEFAASAAQGQSGTIQSGFALAPLLCGSRGALGVIHTVTVALLPIPAARHGLLAEFPDTPTAAQAAKLIMAAPLLPRALEILDQGAASAVYGDASHPLLYLEFDGQPVAVAEETARCREILTANGAITLRPDSGFPTRFPGILPALRKIGPFALENVVCPPSRLRALVEGLTDIANRHALKIAFFGHAGIARARVAIFYGGNKKSATIAAREIFTLELVLNNALTSEADANLDKKAWLARQKGISTLSRDLMAIFDPGGILADNAGWDLEGEKA